jgi:hypothetical protein
MKYAIRKRRGKWTVCTEENVLLDFRNYDEAVETARSSAMDRLDGGRDVKADHRLDQFMRLRDRIEERDSIRFFENPSSRPVRSVIAGRALSKSRVSLKAAGFAKFCTVMRAAPDFNPADAAATGTRQKLCTRH